MGGRILTAVGGLVALGVGAGGAYFATGGGHAVAHVDITHKSQPESLTVVRTERAHPVSGVVTGGGVPLAFATVTAGETSVMTDSTGAFSFSNAPLGTINIRRPGYVTVDVPFDGSTEVADVALDVKVVRGIFVGFAKLSDDAQFQGLIDLADTTTVNGFIFEVKGDWDGGYVYYDTKVAAAATAEAVRVKYDVSERLTQAKDAGLYTIARVPTFISSAYTAAFPAHAILGQYLDPGNRDAWEYPLALAVETCQLGFDEVQFDYVRYPENYPHSLAPNQDARVANIRGFLEEAANRLHPLGCAVSADTFGIVNVATNDQGIGQLIEEVTKPLDVNSPMIYPEQWGNLGGTLGVVSPATHPNATVGAVLDKVIPRVAAGVTVRPFLQAYSLSAASVAAEIAAAEDRGLGWLLWNFAGNYSADALPAGTTGSG